MFWQIIIWWTIANNLNETISFGNSAICRIGCPVYAYRLGRTGDIRHIQYLESAGYGMRFLCNCFGYKRV